MRDEPWVPASPASPVCPSGRPGRYGLTPTLQRCYRYLAHHWRLFGYMPSYRDVATGLGMSESKAPVHRMMHELEERGWLRRRSGSRYHTTWDLDEPIRYDLKPIEEYENARRSA